MPEIFVDSLAILVAFFVCENGTGSARFRGNQIIVHFCGLKVRKHSLRFCRRQNVSFSIGEHFLKKAFNSQGEFPIRSEQGLQGY